jgi:type IV pilus assembly protein PilW
VINKVLKNRNGFTLIEVLVAMVLSIIIMAAIYSTYYSQQKSYIVQEQVAAMQQNLRAATFFMEREIRMAGCDPTRHAGAGMSKANATSITFTEDTDGDGTLTDITYALFVDSDDVKKLGRATGAVYVPVADNIEVLDFIYLDGASPPNVLNDPMTNNVLAVRLPDIRSIEVTVVARTAIEDRTYTDTNNYYNQRGTNILAAPNDYYRRKLLSTSIKCRNLGL